MPSLCRILLIDTHLPGVVELKLNGHTNICGTNASGKTTLQRLIPVFYGEYPSRVVPATRDSFERWYLPRQSSFIIYEFDRGENELCQAVLTSNGSGVNYRFIAKPFELDDYLFQNQAGEKLTNSINELVRTHKKNNILATRALNTKEYRAVIQNDKAVLNTSSNSRELLGFARIFSLSQSNDSLRHIEKLAKAVHSKEGKMETIKAMIAAILEEDGVQPPSSSLNPKRVEDWIRECHLIKEFDSIRPQFQQLEQADHQLNDSERRLTELKQQFSFDLSHLAASILTSQAQVEEIQVKRNQQEKTWAELRDELNQSLSAANADISKYEADLEQVELEYDNWQQQDIETLQHNLQKLPGWISELDIANTRYTLLTEKHQDIESAFNKRMADVSENLSQMLEAFNEEKHQLQQKLAEQQQQEQQQLNQIRQQHQQQKSELQHDFQQQLESLRVEHAAISANLKNAGYNEFEQSQLELMEASISQASQQEEQCREQLKSCRQAHQQAVEQRQLDLQQVENSNRQFQQQEQVVQQVEALLYPGNNSLLEFLRQQQPGWENQLGKIIRPELLQRQDLSPELTQGESLLGLKLDLKAIETPEYAQSEQQLQQQLQSAQQQLASISEQQNQAEMELAKANENVRSCELAQAQAESEVKTAEAARKRAQQDKVQLQQEYQQALSERKQQNKQRLQKNEQQQKQINSRQQQALDELQDQFRETETEAQFHWQQMIEDLRQQQTQLEQQIHKAKSDAKQDKLACEQWLQDELNQRGVDVDEIGKLQKQVKQLKQDIQFTENNRHKLNDYQHWYQNVFTGHKPKWQKLLATARKQASDSQRQLDQQQLEYQQLKQQLKQQQDEHEQLLTQAKDQDNQLQQLNKSLKKLNLPNTELNAEQGSELVNISQRISEAQSLLQTREQLLRDITDYIDHFDRLIAAQAGTGLFDTWEKSREECMTINQQGIKAIDHRRLVSHLDRLLNVIVPQMLQGLRDLGRTFGADLAQYYNVLQDIDKRIASQSKRITQEVDEELFLDGVSDSAVKIRSRISELDFWPALTEFRQLYEQWMQTGASDLPDDEYAHSMRRVMDILGRAALSGGISKLLDIELQLKEGDSHLVIRTDRQLNESSSHGMAYLILCKFLLAFTRLLRGKADATIHWPIDELGTLHQSNIKKIFDACQNNNICVVGAFPNPESEVLTLFDNRYLIEKASRRLQMVQPKASPISQRLKARQQQEGQL